jgi:hypothetical protein
VGLSRRAPPCKARAASPDGMDTGSCWRRKAYSGCAESPLTLILSCDRMMLRYCCRFDKEMASESPLPRQHATG